MGQSYHFVTTEDTCLWCLETQMAAGFCRVQAGANRDCASAYSTALTAVKEAAYGQEKAK